MIMYLAVTDVNALDYFLRKNRKSQGGNPEEIYVLISYEYAAGNMVSLLQLKDEGLISGIMFDSGAYTADKKGEKRSREEYLSFLNLFGHHFCYILNMDDDFKDLDHNRENFYFLKHHLQNELKARLLPVLHSAKYSDIVKELCAYEEEDRGYISIGSNPIVTGNVLAKVMKKFPETRFHMLGSTKEQHLVQNPTSMDTAGWALKAAVGEIEFLDVYDSGRTYEKYSIYIGGRTPKPEGSKAKSYNDLFTADPVLKERFLTFLVRDLGLTIDDVKTHTYCQWSVNMRAQLDLMLAMRFPDYYEKVESRLMTKRTQNRGKRKTRQKSTSRRDRYKGMGFDGKE